MWLLILAIAIALCFLLSRKKKSFIVTDLKIFPIKSCGEIRLQSMKMNETGFLYDREWIILGQDGKMVTQREDSRLLRLMPSLKLKNDELEALDLDYEGKKFSLQPSKTGEILKFSCQGANVEGIHEGEAVHQYLLSAFQQDYRLVRIHKHRQVNEPKAFNGLVSDDYKSNFTDASQCLIISKESFDKTKASLPDRCKDSIDIECFRANITVRGCTPFEEDTWSRFRIGTIDFMGMARCPRCKVTTVDQKTLKHDENFEPVNTLRKVNGNGTKGYFGMYSLGLCKGEIAVGQQVLVRETKKFPDL